MSEKRFEMVTVEDPFWEYGTHLKEVLQDNLTGKQYRAVSRLVDLLNSFVEENEHLRGCYKICKKMLSEAIDENELLECKEGVYNVHNLKRDYENLNEENEQLRKQCFELEKDYLIETSDISDKIYLDDEIKELKQKYGVKNE